MGDKNPSSVKSYDDVLDIIGQFGPWQMRIFFYLWLTSAAGGLAVVVYTFTAFSTPYQCEISQCQTKYNGSHWITLDQDKLIPTPPGQCQYYGIAKRPTKDFTCDDYVSAISDNSVDKINETCGGEGLVFDKTYVTSSLSKYFLHLQLPCPYRILDESQLFIHVSIDVKCTTYLSSQRTYVLFSSRLWFHMW